MNKKCNSFNSCSAPKKLFLLKDGFQIVNCETCGHRNTAINNIQHHVQEVYGDEYFFEGKQGYPNYLLQKELLLQYGKNYATIMAKYTKPGLMLDVGCAAGFILNGFKEAGWHCEGVEPNNTMASYGRKEMKLNITTGDLESFTTNNKFDLVNLTQVIGHFTDVDKAIKNIVSILKKDGFVLVESWDMDSNMAKLMGKYWHEYSPPSVINWFSDNTMNQLFNYYGFELVAKGRPSKKIQLKHAFSLLDETLPNIFLKKKLLNFLSNLFGKYKVIYPSFDVKWYLFTLKNNT
jgi:SAM-dependent methyltransferase